MRAAATLYDELGVPPDASPSEIDRAYRRRARTAHPDTGGSSEAFHALSHAYEVLSDPSRRRRYDETGDDRPVRPDNLAAQALAHIEALIESVLESDVPFDDVDLVAAVRATLDRQKAEMAVAVADHERRARRAETMAARFHRRGGDNAIRRVLERRAAEIRDRAAALKREEAAFAMASDLLSDYSFDHEAPSRPDAAHATIPPRRGRPPR